jgi:hypothetical protein
VQKWNHGEEEVREPRTQAERSGETGSRSPTFNEGCDRRIDQHTLFEHGHRAVVVDELSWELHTKKHRSRK